jgi:hypothetical protein
VHLAFLSFLYENAATTSVSNESGGAAIQEAEI